MTWRDRPIKAAEIDEASFKQLTALGKKAQAFHDELEAMRASFNEQLATKMRQVDAEVRVPFEKLVNELGEAAYEKLEREDDGTPINADYAFTLTADEINPELEAKVGWSSDEALFRLEWMSQFHTVAQSSFVTLGDFERLIHLKSEGVAPKIEVLKQ